MREMDKTYSNGEMVDMLLENPKREAFIFGESGLDRKVIIDMYNEIVWEHNGEILRLKPFYKDRRWAIIEPPKRLKEMSFGEVIYILSHNPINAPFLDKRCFISCISGKSIDRSFIDITKDEYLGLWTVEGVYEDD